MTGLARCRREAKAAKKHLKAGKRQLGNPRQRHAGVGKVQDGGQSCREEIEGGVGKVQEGGQSCREAFEGWQTAVLKP